MKFFLVFTAHSLVCEQTPEHITSPCVVASVDYLVDRCESFTVTSEQRGLLQIECVPLLADAPSLTTEQQQLIVSSINQDKE